MILDDILSTQDIEFFKLQYLTDFGFDSKVYGRNNERYLLVQDKQMPDLYHVVFRYDFRGGNKNE